MVLANSGRWLKEGRAYSDTCCAGSDTRTSPVLTWIKSFVMGYGDSGTRLEQSSYVRCGNQDHPQKDESGKPMLFTIPNHFAILHILLELETTSL
jgi:hypothetical protein